MAPYLKRRGANSALPAEPPVVSASDDAITERATRQLLGEASPEPARFVKRLTPCCA